MPRVDVPDYKTFVDFPDGTPPEEMQSVLATQFPKKRSILDSVVKGPLARVAQGVNSSLGGALSAFGLDAGAKSYQEGAEYWKQKADAAGSSGIPAQIYEGLGGAPMGVAEFVAGVPYAAAKGAVSGYREDGVTGALKEGALEAVKRAGIGKVFHGIGNANLTPLQRTGAMAGTMGAQTAVEGGTLPDVVAATATGALLMPPSGGGAQSVVRSRLQRAGATPEVAADLSGRFNPDIQPAGMGSINTNNVDTMFASDPARPPAIRDSETIALTGNESRPSVTRGPVLDAENASRISPYDATGPSPGISIEVARLKQEHPYWSDAEYLREASKTVLTENPETLPSATDMSTVRPATPQPVRQSEDAPRTDRGAPIGDQEMGQRFGTSDRLVDPAQPSSMLLNPEVLPARTDADRYAAPPLPAERPAEQAPSRTVPESFNHDSLPTAAVTAKDSLVLQDAAPHLKIAVVGTPVEIKQLGPQPVGKMVWVDGEKAYVIDIAAAREKYGNLVETKRALRAGDPEALGYPERPAGEPLQTAAVTKTGEILTEPESIKQAATAGEVAYAAEGVPAELAAKVEPVAEALKPKQPWEMTDAERQAGGWQEVWHGSKHPHEGELSLKRGGESGGDLTKDGYTFGTRDVAEKYRYSGLSREDLVKVLGESDVQKIDGRTTLLHGYLKMENPLRVDTTGYDYKAKHYTDAKGHTRSSALMEYVKQMEEGGHDGIIFTNVKDTPGGKADSTVYYARDTGKLRIKPTEETTRNNASGESAASLEATNELKSRQAKGIETVIVDTRSGKERPAIGVRPEDNTEGLAPYEQMIQRHPDGRVVKLHAGIHLPTLIADAKAAWKHYTEKLDPTAPAGSVKEFLDANRKANEKFGREPLVNKLKRALIDSSANVQNALMRQGSVGEHIRRQFDAISGASAKAQMAVEKQREALSGMSLREQQAMGDMVAIDRDLAITKPGYTKIGGKTDAELRAARTSFQQDYKLTDAEMARVENATQRYFEAWKDNTQRMLDAGLIDATQKQALDAQDYSPKQFLEKIDPDSQAFSSLGGGRVTVPDSGIKRLKEGSDSYFRNNPMRLLSEATARIETRIARNEANVELAKLPTGNGIAEVAKPGSVAPAGYETVTYMENGKPQTLHMKTEYAKEWRQNDPLINSELVNWLQWLTGAKIVRAGATGYNPAFLVSNVPRDLVTIWMQAGKQGYSKHAPIALGEMAADLAKVAGDAWKRSGRYVDYVKQGGGRELLTHEGALSARRENLAPAVAKVQKVLSYVNEFSEIVTRLAYRERMIKNGMDPASASKAAGEYVDFSRGGSVAKAVDRLGIPYLNAAIQGTRSIARAAGRDPGAFAYKMAQMMMGAAGLYALNQATNPEGWANVSDREKADNYIIMLPKAFEYTDKDGTTVSPYLKISKEQSTRPFSTVAELFTHWANGGKPTKQQLEMALGAAVPISIDKMPPAAAAFWTYALNADTYRKEPVWKGKQEIEPYAEYTNNTNPIYTAIGKATATPDDQGVMRGGVSPERLKAGVEKIITPSNAYLQGLGNVLTDAYEKMNPSDKAEFSKTNYEKLRAIPGVSRLLGGAKDTEQFREGIREARTGTATEQFEVNKTLDAMVLRYVKTGKSDAALYDRITDFVEKQSGEARGRLENRIEGLVETADLPDRGWWMAVRALQPEDRADQFKARLKTVSPDEQQRMLEIADGLSGFTSERFLDRYEEQ